MNGLIAATDMGDVASLVSVAVAFAAMILSGFTTALGLSHARQLSWDERIWDRRADLYVDLLEWCFTTRDDQGPFAPRETSETAESAPGLTRHDLRARTAAFASLAVREAYEDAMSAIVKLQQAQHRQPNQGSNDRKLDVFRNSIASRQVVESLERQIRKELQIDPKPVSRLSR